MKNNFFLGSLFLIFVLILTSCGVVPIGNNEGHLTFTLGDDVVNVISSRQASDGGDYKVAFTISGDYSATLEKTATLSTLATTPFEFKGIPIGATVRASCIVSTSSGVQLWSGSSNSIKIAGATNRASITLGVHSGIVVWNKVTGDDSGDTYNLSIASSPASVENATLLGSGLYDSPVFTFGNNVELYYFDTAEQRNSIMVSQRNTQGVYGTPSVYLVPSGYISDIFVRDAVTGKFYSWNDVYVVRLEDDVGSEHFTDLGFDSPRGFVVENDVFYLYSNVDTDNYDSPTSYQVTVGKYKIDFASSGDDDDASDSKVFELDKKTITLPISSGSTPTISDAIIQDGALYLLLRDVERSIVSDGNNSQIFYSRGGVIKINLSTMELDTSFGKGGILGWTDKGHPYTPDDGNPFYFYGPADDTSSNFIGPVKFVGIMPKKLVIAEHGVHVTVSPENKFKGKIKSRVLVVDLETATASVKWNMDYTSSASSYYYETDGIDFPVSSI